MTENTASSGMLNKKVFVPSSAAILLLLIYAASNPEQANTVFQSLQTTVSQNGGWFYILTVANGGDFGLFPIRRHPSGT